MPPQQNNISPKNCILWAVEDREGERSRVNPVEKAKRYLVFLIGLFINSLGVSLITKAELGTSPISSIPYVLSLNFPLTLGQFTILFSLLLIVLQLVILGRNFAPEHALQIPVSVAFGWFIDLCMSLLWFIQPEVYLMEVVYLLIGCAILAVGVYMEMLADVVMLPGESFVRAVVFRWHTEFGLTKVCFDVSMAVIASALSLALSHALLGVREGTVAAAIREFTVVGRCFHRPIIFII